MSQKWTRLETRLIRAVREAKGLVVPYERLVPLMMSQNGNNYEEVPYAVAALRVHLSRIRKKMPEIEIATVRGIGWRWVGEPICHECGREMATEETSRGLP